MRLVVLNHVTLDGVMQAPGRADEDTRGGFRHGGWATTDDEPDPDVDAALAARMTRSAGLVLGRRTYEDLLTWWNAQGGSFKDALNTAPKYVASTTLREPLPWPNSTLLGPDTGAGIRALKSQRSGDLHIMGSGQLIDTLMRDRLIDEFVLIVYPIVLGSGRRLFAGDGIHASLQLTDVTPTARGRIVATYRLAD